MKIQRKKSLQNIIRICCLAGSLFAYSAGAYAEVIANDALPTGGQVLAGTVNNVTNDTLADGSGGVLNLQQSTQAAVVKWQNFDIGTNATVNITGPQDFSILNYVVNGGKMSEIYGTLNAQGGNVFLVNPNGVNITKAAQINVGSLYVSNATLSDEQLRNIGATSDYANMARSVRNSDRISNAELMSLGSIVAEHKVTFDGDRIVIDADRLHKLEDGKDLGHGVAAENIKIIGSDKDRVVFAREVYDGTLVDPNDARVQAKTHEGNTYQVGGVERKLLGYSDMQDANLKLANFEQRDGTVDAKGITGADAYMWVKNTEQLQAMNTNLKGKYALYQTIGALSTEDWMDVSEGETGAKLGFDPIGSFAGDHKDIQYGEKVFSGHFDGLGNSIMGLYINRPDESFVGLFGATYDATIRNVELIGGSITGKDSVGAVVGHGHATTLENVRNTATVTGNDSVGGVAGAIEAIITVDGVEHIGLLDSIINGGTVTGYSNVGGLMGMLVSADLLGDTFNVGIVHGQDKFVAPGASMDDTIDSFSHNVGGLVGHAQDVIIGNGIKLSSNGKGVEAIDENALKIYNQLAVSGGYNVGGIIGLGSFITVANLENKADVKATGFSRETYYYHAGNKITGGNKLETVRAEVESMSVANVGGIVGNVEDGDLYNVKNLENMISVTKVEEETGDYLTKYFNAGNVGGIIGRADRTNITKAEIRESKVFGAHNVGGIAGFFSDGTSVPASELSTANDKVESVYTIKEASNRGSEVFASSAVVVDSVEKGKESVRYNPNTGKKTEPMVIANGGGIVGYMYGNSVKTISSVNSGYVHSKTISDLPKYYLDIIEKSHPTNEEVAELIAYIDANFGVNIGGIVGKIDREKTQSMEDVKTGAAISDSYNTGKIIGFRNIGGVAGMSYNAGIASSYNTGNVNTGYKTTQPEYAVNLGGVLGDGTEQANAVANLYDVYNIGEIGDREYAYGGRHIGGIAGRLTGSVENSYNTGDIYNTYSVTGGLVGYILGDGVGIKNSFNTGNVSVSVQETSEDSPYPFIDKAMVGGIVGSIDQSMGTVTVKNVYNLGNIRSFIPFSGAIGGLIGNLEKYNNPEGLTEKKVVLDNVYFGGYIFAHNDDKHELYGKMRSYPSDQKVVKIVVTNAFYIRPDAKYTDYDGEYRYFNDFTNASGFTAQAKIIDYAGAGLGEQILGTSSESIDKETWKLNSSDWRIYDNTTPILNSFHNSLAKKDATDNLILDEHDMQVTWNTDLTTPQAGKDYQFGTAYNPNLLIINGAEQVNVFDKVQGTDKKVNFRENDSISVLGGENGGNLTFERLNITNDRFFTGVIYADGSLKINDGLIKIAGSGELYGSDIEIYSQDKIQMEGSIVATGLQALGDGKNSGSIKISGNNGIETFGLIQSAKAGETINIAGVAPVFRDDIVYDNVTDSEKILPTLGQLYSKDVISANVVNGNVSFNFSGEDILVGDTEQATNGEVNILYGVDGNGMLTSHGDLNINSNSNIYVDTDMELGGNVEISTSTLEENEIIFDMDNVGKHFAANSLANMPDYKDEKEYVREQENHAKALFLEHFSKNGDGDKIYSLALNNNQAKFLVDLWEEDNTYNLYKYGSVDDLNKNLFNLNVKNSAWDGSGATDKSTINRIVNVWVSNYEQLKGIQDFYFANQDNERILKTNFALKNDIDASVSYNVGKEYIALGTKADGTADEYNGIFYGRNKYIVGLNTANDITTNGQTNGIHDVGIFGKLGAEAEVKHVKVYASHINGVQNAGTITGGNNGASIDNVDIWGVTVSLRETSGIINLGEDTLEKRVGGIVGFNKGTDTKKGTITNTSVTAIIRNDTEALVEGMGGIVGCNEGTGIVQNVDVNATVAIIKGTSNNMGGIAGHNTGIIDKADNRGYLLGMHNANAADDFHQNKAEDTYTYAEKVGGIVGKNEGQIFSVYNEALIAGLRDIGGVVGWNKADATIDGAGNSGSIQGGENIGGVLGNFVDGATKSNVEASIKNVRNNGVITAYNGFNYILNGNLVQTNGKNVGGIIGYNSNSTSANALYNAVNDSSASIYGYENVGGIAGYNKGTIDSDADMINHGKIYGIKNVGGAVGENDGTVANITSDISLYVNETYKLDPTVEISNFGGVAGHNSVGGIIKDATNYGNVVADDASVVGGIVGLNDGTLQQFTGNYGDVSGSSYVGGAIGKNNIALGGDVNKEVYVVNAGKVHASGDVAGGLLGENTADITLASFINKGEVSGAAYVGGLIGVNNAAVAGGRDNGNNFYKYQIYNNGSVSGTTNVGGIMGQNNGTLLAAYNTGSVSASAADGVVGGIVGENKGLVSEVFTTLASGASITGNKLGYVIGYNAPTGKLSDAYSLNGAYNYGVDGNIGVNDGEFISTYSERNNATWKTYQTNASTQAESMLKVFLTNVQVEWNKDAEGKFVKDSLTYDAHEHVIEVRPMGAAKDKLEVLYVDKSWAGGEGTPIILLGTITAVQPDGAHSLLDYFNTVAGKALIEGMTGIKDVSDGSKVNYQDILCSHQINTNGKLDEEGRLNPNNLGFNFVSDNSLLVVPPKDAGGEDTGDVTEKDTIFVRADDVPWLKGDKTRVERERKAHVYIKDGGMKI